MSESHAEHGHGESGGGVENSNKNTISMVKSYATSVHKGIGKVLGGAILDVGWETLKMPFKLAWRVPADIILGTASAVKKTVHWLASPAKSGGGGHGGHH